MFFYYRLPILFFLFFTSLGTYGQVAVSDSIRNDLNSRKNDTSKVILLNTLFDQFEFSNPGFAGELIDSAISISLSIDDKKGLSLSYIHKGFLAEDLGNFNAAIDHYKNSLRIADKINDQKLKAKNLNNIGIVLWKKGDLTNALDSYYKALIISEKINDKNGVATALGNLGIIYMNQADYQKAIDNYYKALKIKQEMGNKAEVAANLGNIGIAYYRMKDYQKALEFYNQALVIDQELGDSAGIARNYSNMGGVYNDLKEFDKSMKYFEKALAINTIIGNKRGLANNYGNIATLNMDLGNHKKAEEFLMKALDVSNEIGYLAAVGNWHFALSELYKKTGQWPLALEHYMKHIAVRDTISNQENDKKQLMLEMNYDFEKKEASAKAEQEKKNAIAAAENKKQKIISLSIAGILFLVLGFAVFAWRSFRQKKRAHEEILKQKEIVENQKLQVEEQKDIIEKQKIIVEEHQREIIDSINYAKRIQNALLASDQLLNTYLKEYFVFFCPKDIVSGDFYWANQLSDGRFALVTADSTGHGVPGAIMSMLNISCLNEAVSSQGLFQPSEILNYTRKRIIDYLSNDGSVEGGKDGMDCSLIVLDHNQCVDFSAANNPVWIVRNNMLEEFLPDKFPVGKHDHDKIPFKEKNITLEKGDMIYTFTDGMADQFGGPKGKKFMYKKLKETLIQISALSMEAQKTSLQNILDDWMGGHEQVDDICIIGIRV